jgi:NADH-quinone oxidoreductase subunit M
MLTAILFLYLFSGSLNYEILMALEYPPVLEISLWFLFIIGFAVKIPMFPFHIWLPEAHVEAPTEGSVILASLLLKLGGYGMLRFNLVMLNEASMWCAPFVQVLCIIGILYASLTALRQVDLKKIIAYSSVAHMNFVVLGIFSFSVEGIIGSVFLMVAHGLVSGALFFLIGSLYKRFHSRLLFYYGGLVQVMPYFSIFFFFFSLANLSFPLSFNFVGELLIFVGIFQFNCFITIVTAFTVMTLTATYSIFLFSRLCFGEYKIIYSYALSDLTDVEYHILSVLAAGTLILGLFPRLASFADDYRPLLYFLYSFA